MLYPKPDTMKNVNLLLLALFFSTCLLAQKPDQQYDKSLADSLGADEYGMKYYVFVILKSGTYNPTDQQLRDSLFRGHMDNITRLAHMNKLVVAGPMEKNDHNYRGIFILNVKTPEEAKELLAADPTIKNHIFEAELYEWYGSAALPLYMKSHERIAKSKF
jgi:uncharacterized protein YciI